MVGVHEHVSFIRLFGLRSTTYVFPRRVMRQYGLRQIIPAMDTLPQPSMEVKGGTISTWYEYMRKLPRWIITKDHHPQVVSKF